MRTVYLDACCLNRPFDDQTQDRIRLESEAVLLILSHIERGEWRWIGSDVLDFEIRQMPALERRQRVQALMRNGANSVSLEPEVVDRAVELEAMGIDSYDALHLACAERAAVDVFLTTDDRLLRRARHHAEALKVRVENPLTWLDQITEP